VRYICSLTMIYLPGTSFEHERNRVNVPLERVKEIRLATWLLSRRETRARSLRIVKRPAQLQRDANYIRKPKKRRNYFAWTWSRRGMRRLNPSHGFALVTCNHVLPWTRAYFATRLIGETIIPYSPRMQMHGVIYNGAENFAEREMTNDRVGVHSCDNARELKLEIKKNLFSCFMLGWHSHSKLIVTYER